MKSILLIVAFTAIAFIHTSFAQDSAKPSRLFQLLTYYYQIKDALINGNSNTAALQAEEFLKTANGISNLTIPEGSRNALVKDASLISATKDISRQRSVFANFSINMYALAKSLTLSAGPIYYDYCPMKNSYWLSSDKVIKNPYFGNAMLTCGSVKETLK
ncbi:MAG: DUF3347 domain-containing protein [Ginsengibacter sp.]